MTILLSAQGIVKEYPAPNGGVRVLDGVSFDLDAGNSLAIMGPSGSGKSTLLNIIGALDRPTSGQSVFNGAPVADIAPDRLAEFRNKHIGFVFQDHHLFPQCTALENVLLRCLGSGRPSADSIERAERLLDAAGIRDKADRYPSELSGGERQRVAVARAMINRPALLLCDEPTGNLDAESAQTVATLFLNLRENERVALIVVTHNAAIAGMFGRVAVLREGRLNE